MLKAEIKKTMTLAAPIVLGQLGHVLMGIVDSVMVGRLGGAPLAAASFVTNIMSIPMVLSMGLATAISVRASHAHGAKNTKECSQTLAHGVLYMLLISFVLLTALYPMISYLHIFNQPKEIEPLATEYLKYLSWSIVPLGIYMALRQFSEGISRPVPPMVFLYLSVGMNVFLNWVFIYGNLGFDPMGLNGAGLATLVSRTFMALSYFGYMSLSPAFKMYRIPINKIQLERIRFKRLFNIGVPSGVQYLFEVGAFSFSGIMMGWISTQALAAHQISLNIATFTFMFVLGVSFATSVRIGQAYGAKDFKGVRDIGVSSLIFAVILMSFNGMVFYLLRKFLPSLYIDNIEIVQIASQLLILAAAFQIFDGVQAISIGILRGMEDVKIPTLITFIVYWVFAIPLEYFYAFKMNLGPKGIWLGLLTGLALSSLFLTLRFLKLASKHQQRESHAPKVS